MTFLSEVLSFSPSDRLMWLTEHSSEPLMICSLISLSSRPPPHHLSHSITSFLVFFVSVSHFRLCTCRISFLFFFSFLSQMIDCSQKHCAHSNGMMWPVDFWAKSSLNALLTLISFKLNNYCTQNRTFKWNFIQSLVRTMNVFYEMLIKMHCNHCLSACRL